MRTLLSVIVLSVAMTACGEGSVDGVDGGTDSGFDGGADVGPDLFEDASDSGSDVQTDSSGTDAAFDVSNDVSEDTVLPDVGDTGSDGEADGSGIVEVMVDPVGLHATVLNGSGRLDNGDDLDNVFDGDYTTCVTIRGRVAGLNIAIDWFAIVSSISIYSGSGEEFNLRNFTITTLDPSRAEETIVELDDSREDYAINREVDTIKIQLGDEGDTRPMTICEVEVFTAE